MKVHWVYTGTTGSVMDMGYAGMNRELLRAVKLAGVETVPMSATDICFHVCTPRMFRPVRAKKNIVFCLSPSTRVLRADLSWVPISTVSVGDELIGFDEQLGRGNKLRRATVEGTSVLRGPGFRVTTSGGEVIASANHRWVVVDSENNSRTGSRKWVRTDELIPGKSRICKFRDPWGAETSRESAWLTGLIDGEGHVANSGNGNVFAFCQNKGVVLDEAKRVLAKIGIQFTQDDYKKCQNIRLRDSLTALGRLRPVRLIPKGHLLWEGQKSWSSLTWSEEVLRVEPIGEIELIGTQTSTKTLIAEGFLSHNTMWESPTHDFLLRPYLTAADHIIVPSNFCKDVFSSQNEFRIAGSQAPPITVVPLGVHGEVFTTKRRKWQPGTRFMWMHIGAPNARKGWEPLEECWMKYFAHREDCFLYGKTTAADPQHVVRQMVYDGWQQAPNGAHLVQLGNVVIDFRRLSQELLVKTFHEAHGAVFPTLGEGWHLPVLESMATACPTVVTKCTGPLDFTTPDTVRYVEWKEAQATSVEPDGLEFPFQAFYPDIESLRDQMEWIMGHYHEALKMGHRAARLARTFSWERTAHDIMQVVQQVQRTI